MMITSNHCSARGRRNAAASMGDLLLELAQSGDTGYGGVARKPPNRFSRERSTPLELACRSSIDASQGIEAGLNDQLGARTGAIRMPSANSGAAALDQGVGQPLVRGPDVTLRRLGRRLECGADDRPAFGVEETVDPDQAVNRLPDAQVTTLVGTIRLGEDCLGVDLVFEVLGDADELAGVHRFGGLQEGGLGLADLGGAQVLGGSGHGHGVLVADLPAGQGFFGPGQLVQLVGHLDSLGGGASRKFSVDS